MGTTTGPESQAGRSERLILFQHCPISTLLKQVHKRNVSLPGASRPRLERLEGYLHFVSAAVLCEKDPTCL